MVVLRKRKLAEPSASDTGLQRLLDAAASCKNLLIFTGSGLSATSGMSTFSTRGGLYERAQKRFAVQDGKKLFTYAFFEKQRLDAMAFFADIYAEAKRAKPSPGHKALAGIAAQGKLQRHYTLNIDGLAQAVGLSTWHSEKNPTGQTLEMHGSIREMVCPDCGHVIDLTAQLLRAVRSKRALPCQKCHEANLRMRIMLYDDGEADVITPDDVFDVLEEDVRDADMILWVGISFQQSASTAYFRRVRGYLQESGRLETCKQAVINLSEDCLWNLLSSCSNVDNLNVMEVLASADEAMPALAARLASADTAFAPSSEPAVASRASAPRDLAGEIEETTARNFEAGLTPAAALHTEEQPPSQQMHPSMQADEDLQLRQEQLRETSAAAMVCDAGTYDNALRQASAPNAAPADSFKERAPSSAALSESPAALAMPARDEQPPTKSDEKSEPMADASMSPALSEVPAALAMPASGEQP